MRGARGVRARGGRGRGACASAPKMRVVFTFLQEGNGGKLRILFLMCVVQGRRGCVETRRPHAPSQAPRGYAALAHLLLECIILGAGQRDDAPSPVHRCVGFCKGHIVAKKTNKSLSPRQSQCTSFTLPPCSHNRRAARYAVGSSAPPRTLTPSAGVTCHACRRQPICQCKSGWRRVWFCQTAWLFFC
jgi:hypothetical protein